MALDAILAFLASIGIGVEARSLDDSTLLPGVTIDGGIVVYDPAKLEWPGDLLHEAGHIAVTPPSLRAKLSDKIPEDLMAEHAGEPEATAWAFAAVCTIGIDPAVLFHEGGYHGKSQGLIFTYSHGVAPGLAGLRAAGMAIGPVEAKASGERPYPAMRHWLRERG